MWMPVLSATDMLVSKLNALNEHHCNLASVIPVARALREQIDWPKLREEVAWNDFAVAASFLLDRLQVPPPT